MKLVKKVGKSQKYCNFIFQCFWEKPPFLTLLQKSSKKVRIIHKNDRKTNKNKYKMSKL